MKAGQLLAILADIVTALRAKGIITPAGDLVDDLSNIANDVELATIVEGAMKANGVTIPSKIDNVIKLLPLILQLVN